MSALFKTIAATVTLAFVVGCGAPPEPGEPEEGASQVEQGISSGGHCVLALQPNGTYTENGQCISVGVAGQMCHSLPPTGCVPGRVGTPFGTGSCGAKIDSHSCGS